MPQPKYVVTINGQEKTIDKDKFEQNSDAIIEQYPDATIKAMNKAQREGVLPLSRYKDAVSKGGFSIFEMASETPVHQIPAASSLGHTDYVDRSMVLRPDTNNNIAAKPATDRFELPDPLGQKDSFPKRPEYVTQLSEDEKTYIPSWQKNLTEEEKQNFTQRRQELEQRFRERQSITYTVDRLLEEVTPEAEASAKRWNDEQLKFMQEHPFEYAMTNSGYGHVSPYTDPLNVDSVYQSLYSAEKFLKDSQKIIQQAERNAKEGSTFFKNAGYGIKDGVFDIATWDMGMSDLVQSGALLKAIKKSEAGKGLLPYEDKLLTAAAVNLATEAYYGSEVGRGYKAGKVTAESIPFMLEMIANPASGAGKGIAKSVAKYGIKKFGATAMRSAVGKITRAGTRVAGDVLGSAIMAGTTGAGHVAADATNRQIGDISYDITDRNQFQDNIQRAIDTQPQIMYAGREKPNETLGTSVAKAFGARTIENFSEMIGNYFAPVGKLIGNSKAAQSLGATKVGQFIHDISASDWAKVVGDIERKAQWSGAIGEYGEEVAGTILNTMFVGDNNWSDLTDVNQQVDTFLGVSLMGGFFSAVKTAGYRNPTFAATRKLKKADTSASEMLGSEWTAIREHIDKAENMEALNSVLSDVVTSEALSRDQKTAVMDYAAKRNIYEGIITGEQKKTDEQGKTPLQTKLEKSYTRGQEVVEAEAQIKQQIKADYDAASSQFPQERLAELNAVDNAGEYIDAHPEETEQLSAYFESKAQYEGLIDGTYEAIRADVESAGRQIDLNTHPNGNVYSVELNDNDKTAAHIVSGDIVLNEDNQIDFKKSGERVVVRTLNGAPEMRDIRDIARVTAIENAAEVKDQSLEQLYESAATVAAEEIEGNSQVPEANSQVSLNIGGNSIEAYIQEANTPEGTVIVQFDEPVEIPNVGSGQVLEMTPQQLSWLMISPAQNTGPARQDVGSIPAEQTTADVNEQAVVIPAAEASIDDNTDTEQFPRTKSGDIDYGAIADPAIYAGALSEEFGSEAADVLGELITEQNAEFKKASKKANAVERRRAVLAAETELAKLNAVRDIIAPSEIIEQKPIVAVSKKQKTKRTQFQMEIAALGDPVSIEDVIYQDIAAGKRFRWKDQGVSRGLATMLGFSNDDGERKKRIGITRNDGDTIDKYAERLYFEYGSGNEDGIGYQWNIDDADIRDILLDIHNQIVSPKQALEAAKALRKDDTYEALSYAEGFEGNERLNEKDVLAEGYANAPTDEEIAELYEEPNVKSLPLQKQNSHGEEEQIQTKYNTRPSILHSPETLDNERGIPGMAGRGMRSGDAEVYGRSGTGIDARQGDRPATSAGTLESSNTFSGLRPDRQFDNGGGSSDIKFNEQGDGAASELTTAESEVDTAPTEAQKEAGNYQKGHVKINGFDITIENPKGSMRSGVDADGNAWSQGMNNTYGYFKRTKGKDGDHIDVFIGDHPESKSVFVVDQINRDGTFDEHKVMLGFDRIEQARDAYMSNYEQGWQGLGAITAVELDEFRKWLDSGTRKQKPFAEYANIPGITESKENLSTIPTKYSDFLAEPYEKINEKTQKAIWVVPIIARSELFSEVNAIAKNSEGRWSNYVSGRKDRDNTGFIFRSWPEVQKFIDKLHNATQQFEAATAMNYGQDNSVVTKEKYEELKARMREKLGQLNAGFDPEIFSIGAQMAMYHIEAGARSFSHFAANMINDLGSDIRPYLKSFYEGARQAPGMESFAETMDSSEIITKFDITAFNAQEDVYNRPTSSERDSHDATNGISADKGDVRSDRGTSRRDGNATPVAGTRRNRRQSGSTGGSGLFALDFGEQSDNGIYRGNGQPIAPHDAAGVTDGRGSIINGPEGLHTEPGTNNVGTQSTEKISGSFAQRAAERLKLQQAAEVIPVEVSNSENIAATLPILLPEQHDDVYKAEERFFNEENKTEEWAYGKGILFTNGTGTGKTFTGLGIVKRFVKQGEQDILIVVPTQPKVADWIEDGRKLNLKITALPDTFTAGNGVVITTYANFRTNDELLKRTFGLVMYDECHRLMEEQNGSPSATTQCHFKITNRDKDTALRRLQSFHPLWIESTRLHTEINAKKTEEEAQPLKNELAEIEKQQAEVLPAMEEEAAAATQKTKVVFLSATPFKGHFNLRYAKGYLFDWKDETTYEGYSRVDPESRFFLDNFGGAYEWKYHRLQKRGNANADAIAMQEVQFAERMMQAGVMSGRTINSERDYSREFPRVTGLNTEQFNKALADIYDYETQEFEDLRSAAADVFYDYEYSTKLFESLKTSMSIPRIREHLALGRKVVLFHRRKQAGVRPPFASIVSITKSKAQKILTSFSTPDEKESAKRMKRQAEAFAVKYADLLKYERTLDYSSAITQLSDAFGERAVFINGDIQKKEKSQNIRLFNNDNSGKDIIVVQEESGKEGISLHDTTGAHQRVLMSLSMPRSSITALQIEGRIYRIGQESDAVFEYPLLGLDMEISHFGQTINRKLSTTENLAVGEQSRDLIRSFAEGVLFSAGEEKPHMEQGKGGKEYDRKQQQAMSEFRKAILVYNTNQKQRGKRDQRAGIDYFATPEPVGQKMVEWLGLKAGDTAMEPSAGHGAIAMWFPSYVNATVIEPSYKLFSKLTARSGGGERKMLNTTFEDHHIVNKYDAIAMNPPFGSGGKTAMDHLEKAFSHLRKNGRVVAIIPGGASMDKRLDKFLYGTDGKGHFLNPDAQLIAEIKLPPVAFEQAGTSVFTKIIVIDKKKTSESESTQTKHVDLGYIDSVDELFNRIEGISIPERTQQENSAEYYFRDGEKIDYEVAFNKIANEYSDLIENSENNPNFENDLNEWRDRKAVVIGDFVSDLAVKYGIDNEILVFNSETRNGTLPEIILENLEEWEESKGRVGGYSPDTRQIILDVAQSDSRNSRIQYEQTFVHEATHAIIPNLFTEQELEDIYNEAGKYIGYARVLESYSDKSNPEKGEEILAYTIDALVNRSGRNVLSEVLSGQVESTVAIEYIKRDTPLTKQAVLEILNSLSDGKRQDKEEHIRQYERQRGRYIQDTRGNRRSGRHGGTTGTNTDGRTDAARIYRPEEIIAETARSVAESLNVPIRIIEDVEDIINSNPTLQQRQRKSRGWFDSATNEVVIVLPNHFNAQDVTATVLHEAVGHYGLRNLFGNQFDTFLDNVYSRVDGNTKRDISLRALRQSDIGNIRKATEEYIAGLAEEGIRNPYAGARSAWETIKSIFRNLFNRIGITTRMSDNDLRYILWKSHNRLRGDESLMEAARKISIDSDLKEIIDNDRLRFLDKPKDDAARFSMARELYEESTAGKLFKYTEAYQDSMLGLKHLQDAVMQETGNKLKDYEDAYTAENQMSSKSTYETEFYRGNFFSPMINAVSAVMGTGFTYDQIIGYVMAKSGLERNDVFAMRDAQKEMDERVKMMNAEMQYGLLSEEEYAQRLKEYEAQREEDYKLFRQKDYSGLTQMAQNMMNEPDVTLTKAEELALQIVSDTEAKSGELTAQLWENINKATKETLRKSYESGLMTRANYNAVRDMFKYYVPMRGWQEDTAADVWDYIMTERSPFSATVSKAKGRKSVADDPFATIGNMAESAILEGNRNKMKQRFLNMALNHKTPLLTVKGIWYENRGTGMAPDWQESFPNIPENATPDEIDAAINVHETRMKELEKEGMAQHGRAGLTLKYRALTPEKNEHIVTVKSGGKEYAIYVNGNPRAAQAVNGLTNEARRHQMHRGLANVQRFNWQLAANFTTRNPAFVLSNMSRDMLFAGAAVFVKEDAKYNKNFIANLAWATRSIWPMMYRYYNGKLDASNPRDMLFKEFLENGGETGYTALHNVEQYKTLINRRILDAQGRVDLGRIFLMPSGKWVAEKPMSIVKALQGMASGIAFTNRCAEDVSRFTTYMTSREAGRSIQNAVADAKEITVNFNKKGAGGYGATTLKSLYLFFNAAVQSLNNFRKLAKKNPLKFSSVIGSYMAMGVMMPLLNQFLIDMFGDDDDKDAYNNLPDWARKNNFCFYIGNGKFITIPLPIELRAFYGIGEIFYQTASGNMRHKNIPLEVVGQIADLMPINVMGNDGNVFSGKLEDIISVVMPDAGKPVWQVIVNKDFFGKPIFKDTDFNKRMPAFSKAYGGTSQALVSSSELLNEISGGDKYTRGVIDMNPAVVEHIFEGYFGGTAKTINQLGKTISMIWNEEQRVTRNVPVVSRFVSATDERNAFSRVNEEYFAYLEEYHNTQQRLRGYSNEADEGSVKYAEKEAFLNFSPQMQRHEIMKSYQTQIKELQKYVNEAANKEERSVWENMLNMTKAEIVEQLRSVED